MKPLEKHLGRPLTPADSAIAEACGGLQALALICIQESLGLATTQRLVAYVRGVFELHAQEAARLAADVVRQDRAARAPSGTTH